MQFLGSNFDEENALNSKEENSGLLSSIKNVFSPKEEVVPNTCGEKILSWFEVEKSYTSFFVVIGFGLCILFLSFMFLPLAIFNPQKFVSLFSLGTFIVILSFIFIYGTREYIKMLFSQKRALLTSLYLVSICIGIVFSFRDSFFIISYVCAAIQLITVVTFFLSFVPGGETGISFIWSSIKSIFIKSS